METKNVKVKENNKVANFLNSCEMKEIVKTRKNNAGIYFPVNHFQQNENLKTFLKDDEKKLNRSKIRRYFHNYLDNATICENGKYFAKDIESIKTFLGFAKNVFSVFMEENDLTKILSISNFCQSTDKDNFTTTEKQINAVKEFLIKNM